MAKPRPLFSHLKQHFNEKIVGLSGIRTRIVGVTSEHADHYLDHHNHGPFLLILNLTLIEIRLQNRDFNGVGWGNGPWALVTPVKAIKVGVGGYKK